MKQWREIVAAFESGSLPRVAWTHRAHLIVGLWFTMKMDATAALEHLRTRIRSYNIATGTLNTDHSGYHETLTRLYLIGMLEFVRDCKSEALSPVELLDALLESPIGNKAWPFKYYTRERLMSLDARQGWVAPDLEDLPSDLLNALD